MSAPARQAVARRQPASAPPKKRPRHLRLVHSRGHQPHGTRACYVFRDCRCTPCRAANAADWRARQRALPTTASATSVRRHLARLESAGVGYRQVAAAAGVAERTVWEIRSGARRRVSLATWERILAVGPDAAAPGALVDARASWRLVEQLVAAGRSRAWIARQLGAGGRELKLGRHRTTVERARAIEDLARREGVL